MDYLILFLEGIITFVSPCILPMIPIYITYFMGDQDAANQESGLTLRNPALKNSIGFVLGFTTVFVLLGAAAGSIGRFVFTHGQMFNIITGVVMVLFGLNYIDVINIKFLKRTHKIDYRAGSFKFSKSVLFGMVFSIGWSPCVGAFLGSALMIAANSQTMLKGSLMLFVYSLGLGVPFILSSLLINSLKSTFDFIKRNYRIINNISGIFLILVGIMMMTGIFTKLIVFFS
ncbi:MAG: cytochrome c biogenesis protein CcdA [Proteocatella sp.]|jgi:cytochrome c-type biogenesis protein|nr:cytochrome c biogenesis protein CcdA [Proteocatella sp.]MBP7913451.1 cytochrome c biogenesis protein CcdA [Proteocatella sp.]MBP8653961.1 cytochrome c biogenesis protein CcdA [Proteocatella sp.]MBP9658583.1 cytochrome c biogenesis protein CcdA [Proteocatella sp.]NCB72400.1 cytochrome c biogenesis protein CcdA [Clostridia bacterium]